MELKPPAPEWTLPPVLAAVRDHLSVREPGQGLLFHDLSLATLIRLSASAAPGQVVDLDSVEGLAPDEAALEFLARRLGVGCVITRRGALAARAREWGLNALVRVHCLDSTGLERALDGHPGAGVGTALSPGLMLAHLPASQLEVLPRPLLAYGLLRTPAQAAAALAAGADAAVLIAAEEAPGRRRPAEPARARRHGAAT